MSLRPIALAALLLMPASLAAPQLSTTMPTQTTESLAPKRAQPTLEWEVSLGAVELRTLQTVLVAGGAQLLVITDDGVALRSARDGSVIWRRNDVFPPGVERAYVESLADPVLAWAGPESGNGWAFEVLGLADGERRLRVPLNEAPSAAPVPLVSLSGTDPYWHLPVDKSLILVLDGSGKRVSETRLTGPVRPPLIPLEGRILAAFGENRRAEFLGQGRRGRRPVLRDPSTATVRGEWLVAAEGRTVGCWQCRERRRATLSCRKRWQSRLGGDSLAPPLQTDDAVYVASRDTFVHAYKKSNGHLRWRRSTGSRLTRSPLVWDDLLIVTAAESARVFFMALSNGASAGSHVTSRSESIAGDATRAGNLLIVPYLDSTSGETVLRAYSIERIDPADDADQ